MPVKTSRMGTERLLVFKEPSIFGPANHGPGLSRALQKAIDSDASAFAVAPAGEPQYYYGLFSQLTAWTTCHGCTPMPRCNSDSNWSTQLAPHLQGASQTWTANLPSTGPVKPVNPPKR